MIIQLHIANEIPPILKPIAAKNKNLVRNQQFSLHKIFWNFMPYIYFWLLAQMHVLLYKLAITVCVTGEH